MDDTEPNVPRYRQAGVTRPVLTVLLALALSLTGCVASPAAPLLDGREFLSISVTEQGAVRQLVPGTLITIRFADGQLSASAGCNIMGGAYRIEGERLRVDAASVTEIGCDPARHAQDDWLFAFLGSAPTFRLTGNDLVLESGGTIIRLLDRKVAEPDLPLVGPTWTVVSIISGDAVSSVPEGVVASLEFQADGRVRIATGCNDGGARVTVESGSLRFGEITLTKRACPGAAGQVEAAFLAVLRADVIAFRIDGQVLDLRAGERGLQLQAVVAFEREG